MIKKFLKIGKRKDNPNIIDANKNPPPIGTKDNRQYFRVDAEIPICLVSVPQGALYCGYCQDMESNIPYKDMITQEVNISGGGLYTLWRHPFDIGSHVAVFMILKGIKEDGLVVCGEVVRCQKIGKYYGIALRFLCRRDFKRNLILKFVTERERELIAKGKIGWIR